MATVSDIATAALRELGVLGAGETATADEADDALTALNNLIDQWAAERLQIYTITRTTWTINSGDGEYAVGTGADVNVARPVFVEHVNLIDTSTDPDHETQLTPLTDDAWSRMPMKALTAPMPTCWYYNPTFPTGTLTLWPVPTDSTLAGALYAPAAVAQFAAINTSFALPPGYQRMVTKALALELAPSYERQPSPLLVEQAREARAVVKRANTRLMDLSIDAGALVQGRATYNILCDG